MISLKLVVSLSLLLSFHSAFAQQTIVGHWEGNITIQGQDLIINVDIKQTSDGPAGTIDIPQQNARGLALRNIRYEHPSVYFELPAGPSLAVFDGQRKDSTISGKFTQAGIVGSFHISLLEPGKGEVAEEPPPTYKPIVGVWSGATDLTVIKLAMAVTFKTKSGELKAAIDIPQQHSIGLVLSKVSFDSPRVHFELVAGPGLAIWDGTMSGDTIGGTFTQSGIIGTFRLTRGPLKVEKEAEEDVPYKKEEVTFYVDSIKIAGTLTLPPTGGPHPAVVMITGSGPQNRDEELFGFKPFKIIADYFTRHGIAVLRDDDRGVGGSTGSNEQSTTADFAKDALAAIHYLQSRGDINPKQIGLCGHSEGGIVAPLAASESRDVAFIICVAGTGVTGAEIILAQQELIMRANGSSQEKIGKSLSLTRRLLDATMKGGHNDELKKEIRDDVDKDFLTMPEEQRKIIADTEQYLNNVVNAQMRSLQSPWYRFFISYDPAPALERVKCPVLALFGGLDLQVPAELNQKKMEAALKKGGNKDFTFKIFPRANHLFLTATNGSPKEYGTLKKEFVSGFLDTMTGWILARVTVPR